MDKLQLLAHLREEISKGGHSTAMFKSDPTERIIDKHRKDHAVWKGLLKHSHPKPVVLQAPDAV
jgi:hypothetical protein